MALPPIPSQLHPVLNHVPIVLLPLAALLATLAPKREWAWQASRLVLVLAALFAVAAVVTGLDWAAALANGREGQAQTARAALLGTHRLLGLTTAAVAVALAGLALWKKDALRTGAWAWAWPTLLWLATLLVLATAWYGGALVFERPAGFPRGGFGGFRGNGTAQPTTAPA